MPRLTKEDIRRAVAQEDVKFIRLQFTDIFGNMKNVAITENQLDRVLDGGYVFDGSSIEGMGRVEESDMLLEPDLSTFIIFPWRPQRGRVARLICNVLSPENKPYPGCCRTVLRKVSDDIFKAGYSAEVVAECEFFLFYTDEHGRPTTRSHDKAGYFDLAPFDLGENVRREICMTLQDMDFNVESSHHEMAGGQHEITFSCDDPLDAADKLMSFKTVVRIVAQKHGFFASFMPKPLNGVHGSGLHLNIRLRKKGVDAIRDKADKNGLSADAYGFIAGLMKNINGMTAVLNPLVNSYKRLVSGFEAPVHVAWSLKNHSPLIRVPAGLEPAFIELRSPDPSCNPYLALALIFSAGLEGIKNGRTPPQPVYGNLFKMSDDQLAKQGIEKLPRDLRSALCAMQVSALAQEVLGEEIFTKFIGVKRDEWEDYHAQVSAWEMDQYLENI